MNNYKLIDVHCHLESIELYDNLDSIIENAKKINIVKLITSSVSSEQWHISRSISEKYNEVEFSLGIHPWYASIEELNIIEDLSRAKEMGAVAIGEIGLDKKIKSPDFDLQLKTFEQQLIIANEIELPVIIHCRGAFNELILSIKKIGIPEPGGIIHSFSGSAEIAEEFIKYGLSFSIGGILTYKKSNKRIKLLNKIFPDHFLLETDSPDIPPVNIKNTPNVPENIIYNLKSAAEILGISEEIIADKTTENAVKIFDLSL